jgi:chitodextrinase
MRFSSPTWLRSAAVVVWLAAGTTAVAQDSPKELKELDTLEGYRALPKETTVKGDLENLPQQLVETMIVWSEASPTSGKAPLTVTFTADPPPGIANPSYAWTFGDGSSASGAKVSHTFTSPGVYKVLLKVASPKGDLGMDELRIKVTQ